MRKEAGVKNVAAGSRQRKPVTTVSHEVGRRTSYTDSDCLLSLAQWRYAARSWEGPAAALERAAAASNEQQQGRAQALRDEIRSYIDDYGEPVVGIARVSPSAVRSSDANTEGSRRLSQPWPRSVCQ